MLDLLLFFSSYLASSSIGGMSVARFVHKSARSCVYVRTMTDRKNCRKPTKLSSRKRKMKRIYEKMHAHTHMYGKFTHSLRVEHFSSLTNEIEMQKKGMAFFFSFKKRSISKPTKCALCIKNHGSRAFCWLLFGCFVYCRIFVIFNLPYGLFGSIRQMTAFDDATSS